tara:strand:- start:929 stop:2092 length:1164 start_codon:yes stop_codon:yes gene_type:complete
MTHILGLEHSISGIANQAQSGLTNLFGLGDDGDGFLGSTGAGLLGAIGQAALGQQGIKDLAEARRDYQTQLRGDMPFGEMEGGILGELRRESQFKPFTVTTGTGQTAATTVNESGQPTGLNLQLTDREKALQNSLLGFGQDMFSFLSDPAKREEDQTNVIKMLTQTPKARATREQELFDRLEAIQAPERERARLNLEQRLVNQGRSGVRSAMFGGTPEELALAKAVEEQKSRNVLGAMDQARAEQALSSQQTLQGLQEFRNRMATGGQLGLSAIPAAYTPQAGLLSALNPMLQLNRNQIALDLGRGELFGGLAESGLEADLGIRALENALRQQQYKGLFDLLAAERSGQGGEREKSAFEEYADNAMDAYRTGRNVIQSGLDAYGRPR